MKSLAAVLSFFLINSFAVAGDVAVTCGTVINVASAYGQLEANLFDGAGKKTILVKGELDSDPDTAKYRVSIEQETVLSAYKSQDSLCVCYDPSYPERKKYLTFMNAVDAATYKTKALKAKACLNLGG